MWLKHYAGQDSCGQEATAITVDPSNGTVYALSRDGQCLLGQADLIAYSPFGTAGAGLVGRWPQALGSNVRREER